ncbi:MAG: alanine--tRNA ligase [Acidimicrobiales bacterium]|nr:MAG: alanine--tRNA ligase [Acidimicrobiales bacterium]
MAPRTAHELRRAWVDFFSSEDHLVVPSSSLIPHHPTAPLFTNAGMNQFVPFFLGEEPPPHPRAASVQRCVRTGDIDVVGTTARHLTFFEMLGNFSFGDYFKEGAIRLAWRFSTEVLEFDPERIWVTVHHDDDEAAEIWRDAVGVPQERIQRLGDEDNFWEMQKGAPGPCGPNTELYFDRGEDYGAGGGPAHGSDDRYLEFWNLVFMQYERTPAGDLADLPSRNVDTGAGLERNLVLLQDVPSVFETDVLAPLVSRAASLCGVRYGESAKSDVSLRILADHTRAVAFCVADGVFPSNEDRGYVLRRLLRRLVRHAYLLGAEEQLVAPTLVAECVELMGEAYPELAKNRDFVLEVVEREESRFRQTLRAGMNILDGELERIGPGGRLDGSVAFVLHDTHGFPLELTEEIARERGVEVDREGFDRQMREQKERARSAAKDVAHRDVERFRQVLEEFGPTEFVGRDVYEIDARVIAVVGDVVVLDRTPFYAEAGGQVGDTGVITADGFRLEVVDTVYVLPGLHGHVVRGSTEGVGVGMRVHAAIDAERRERIRRHHTATHLLHWALREVLGEHVKQQGSLVAPDRLRFDFSHYQALTPEEIAAVEDLANAQVIANHPVRHYETSREYAEKIGAIAFFGEKYGERVRVLEAGPHSVELCGGTHVHQLGDIGLIKIVSEGSIGSNLRRIEAVAGLAPVQRMRELEATLSAAAEMLGVPSQEILGGLERRMAEMRQLKAELAALRTELAAVRASELAATAENGIVTGRVDGLGRDDMRTLAMAVRERPGVRAVVLGGVPPEGGVALVAVAGDGIHAGELIGSAVKAIGGGGNTKAERVAMAGGRDPSGLEEALRLAREAAEANA